MYEAFDGRLSQPPLMHHRVEMHCGSFRGEGPKTQSSHLNLWNVDYLVEP